MEKRAYQEIIDKIHFYMENPHLNPMDMDYNNNDNKQDKTIEL
tara:strand:- start:498 stop:626 length:129 start_codon:yes stop_codon:yes gene_type:complete